MIQTFKLHVKLSNYLKKDLKYLTITHFTNSAMVVVPNTGSKYQKACQKTLAVSLCFLKPGKNSKKMQSMKNFIHLPIF